MKRAVTALGTLAGLVLVILAMMLATLLGVSGTWRTETVVPAGRDAIVVGPVLASVIGPRVTVRVETGDRTAELFVGRARPDDAKALLDGVSQVRIDGLNGARRLSERAVPGRGVPLAPAASDIWQTSTVGTGTVSAQYRPVRGAESMVIARSDGQPLPALNLSLAWTDRRWTWMPVAMLVLGLVLLAVTGRRRPATPGRRRSR